MRFQLNNHLHIRNVGLRLEVLRPTFSGGLPFNKCDIVSILLSAGIKKTLTRSQTVTNLIFKIPADKSIETISQKVKGKRRRVGRCREIQSYGFFLSSNPTTISEMSDLGQKFCVPPFQVVCPSTNVIFFQYFYRRVLKKL